MSNTDKGTAYERFVQRIMQAMLSAQDVTTTDVKHNVKIKGNSGQEHQIDVYWEYRLGGVTHKVAIECKNWKDNVELGVALHLKGILDDVPGLRGIIISPVGFQEGAKTYARQYGIGLKIIREPEEGDYVGDGWVLPRAFVFEIHMHTPVFRTVNTLIDKLWADNNASLISGGALREFVGKQDVDDVLEILDTGYLVKKTIRELLEEINTDPEIGLHTHKFRWTDAWKNTAAGIKVKISGIDVVYETYRSIADTATMPINEDCQGIIRDIIAGTLLIVQKDSSIVGDTDKEGIRKPTRR